MYYIHNSQETLILWTVRGLSNSRDGLDRAMLLEEFSWPWCLWISCIHNTDISPFEWTMDTINSKQLPPRALSFNEHLDPGQNQFFSWDWPEPICQLTETYLSRSISLIKSKRTRPARELTEMTLPHGLVSQTLHMLLIHDVKWLLIPIIIPQLT